MKYTAPRGTHDIWGEQVKKLQDLENKSRNIFKRYNYSEIRLPTFESAELFTRSIGEATDIVEKEMYVFEDRKGRKLALRPEGTASVVRAYLENNLEQNLPLSKLYYMGPMFRYERPQAGRSREFYQIGAEYFNNPAPAADAEIILLAKDILASFGLKESVIHLHTLGCPACRDKYRDALKNSLKNDKDLCEDCKKRIDRNPLRVLDCKVDSPKVKNLPKMEEFLCDECKTGFQKVQGLLTEADCPFIVDSCLVRGLDYYTSTVFEVKSKGLGSQDALAAGGRYDNLVKELGGPQIPAVGFALGSERVLMAAANLQVTAESIENTKVFVAVSNDKFEKQAFKLVNELRAINTISVEGPFANKSLKSQLKVADKIGAARTIIFGEEEYSRNTVVLRDMKTQVQQEININDIVKRLSESQA